jgi:hypothetical protein
MHEQGRKAQAWVRYIENWDRVARRVQELHDAAGYDKSGRKYLIFMVGGWSAIQTMSDGDTADLDRIADVAARAIMEGTLPRWEYGEGSPVQRAFQKRN